MYGYDGNGNLTTKQALPDVAGYGYDALDRLVSEVTTLTTNAYTYDGNGNRLSGLLPNGNTQSYSYSPQTNRLTQKGNQAFVLDAAGNTISDRNENRQFSYNDAGRLTQVTRQGTVRGTYSYNHQFQRTRKVKVTATGATRTFVYHYDMQGQLISETKEDGTPVRSYVWADNEPIAQIQYKPNQQSDQLLYVHTDQINTPRLATDSTLTPVWRWEAQAFGQGQPDNDPDDDNINNFVRLRHPGQYYDSESGLFYNWNRYYDPKVGRYVTSDPVGLAGGLNTFAYALNSPARWTDPTGLMGQGPGGGGRSAPGSPRFGGGGAPAIGGPFGPVCGSGPNATWIPDGPWKSACEKHDKCYETCEASRLMCDFRFIADGGSILYFIAIRAGGRDPYEKAQSKCCKQN